jgi:AcrR family transcriptional regulator
MRPTEDTTDLRIRRTRKLLQESLLHLLAKKSFQAITVKDICETAMVNRSTFYDHFPDKYALMEHTISDRFRQQLETRMPGSDEYSVDNLRALITTMWEFFGGLHGSCRHADEQDRLFFQSRVIRLVQAVLAEWLPRLSPPQSQDPSTQALAAAMASWAMYGAAHYWVEERPQGTGMELADRVVPILHGILVGQGRSLVPQS